jgi:hypothetical protein
LVARLPIRPSRAILLLIVAAIIMAATFLRQVDVPKSHTVWAEDGAVFTQCAWDRGAVACVAEPYGGYLHLVPRLASFVAPLGDPAQLGLRLTLLAALVACAAALAAAAAIADVTGSLPAAALGSAGLVVVYQAGREVSGNLANLHWILLAASVMVILAGWMGRRPRPGDLVLVVGTALSSAMAPLLLVLAVVPAALRLPRGRLLLAVTASATAVQALVIALSHRTPPSATPLASGALLAGLRRFLFDEGWFGPTHHALNHAVLVLQVVAIVGLWAILWRRPLESDGARWRSARAALAVTALPVIGVAVFVVSALVNGTVNPRYAYVGSVLILASIAIAVGLGARQLRTPRVEPLARRAWAGTGTAALVVTLVVVAGLGVAFASSFRLKARASAGPDTRREIADGRDTCRSTDGSLLVPISPARGTLPTWTMSVPCGALAR